MRFHQLGPALLRLMQTTRANPTIGPEVIIGNGTVVGRASPEGVEYFHGIPYAEPPLGALRLARPEPLANKFDGPFNASGTARACPQMTAGGFSDYASLPQGEDCLNLNIERPTGTNGSSKLPVVVWIYGGGFEVGATQLYDGTEMVTQSVREGQPVIFAAMNYRLNGLGFLGGREVKSAQVSNLGLRDQRLALQWLRENIDAFGGDPDKVILFGESAGSLSTFLHTIVDSGEHRVAGGSLFQGAVMHSGSVLPTAEIDSPQAQRSFDALTSAAGCSAAADQLDCLRKVPYDRYVAAVNTFPTMLDYTSLALPFLPRPDPSDNFYPVSAEIAVECGNFSHVPVIIGSEQDEGTIFSLAQTNLSTSVELHDYLKTIYPHASDAVLDKLLEVYPEDPVAGSPFGTRFDNQLYPQFKRLSAILGDVSFTLQRRNYLTEIAHTVPSWSFLDSHRFAENDYGTYHSADIEALYHTSPIVPSESGQLAARAWRSFYAAFAHTLDPNTSPGPGGSSLYWPRYTTWDKSLLNLRDTGLTLVQDNFRAEAYEFLRSHLSDFRL
ncbi:lipase 3 precursor [Hortaea werneckii]|nr:lipase 3 precursor [Hortaea werneckii]